MVRAGDLDERITIETRVLDTDELGGTKETFPTSFSVWARYLPAGGQEKEVGAEIRGQLITEFLVRYRRDIHVTDRVIWRSRIFDIAAINDYRREGKMYLKCVERRTAGPQAGELVL